MEENASGFYQMANYRDSDLWANEPMTPEIMPLYSPPAAKAIPT